MTAGNNYDVNIEMKIPRIDIIYVSIVHLTSVTTFDKKYFISSESAAVRQGIPDSVPDPDGRHRVSLQLVKTRPRGKNTSENTERNCQKYVFF